MSTPSLWKFIQIIYQLNISIEDSCHGLPPTGMFVGKRGKSTGVGIDETQ